MATVITNTDIGALLGISGSPQKLVATEQLRGQNYIVVYGKNQTPQQNGFELISKYNFAKVVNPYGQPKSDTNRFTIFVAPGQYEFSVTDLDLDTPYIDIVSLSGEADVFITSNVSGIPFTVLTSDIKLKGFNLGTQAIFINSSYGNNYFENIIGGESNFSNDFSNGDIAGNFKNCIGGNYSFGDSDYNQTVYSSTFENCTAGDWSFGYSVYNSNFKNCTAGSYSFSRTNGTTQILNSVFNNCTALEGSFGNYIENSTFLNCKADYNSFGMTSDINMVSEIYNSNFQDCKAGNYSFGVRNGGDVKFIDCSAGTESFGADIASATYKNCTAASGSFGAGLQGWSTLQAGGYFYNCVSEANSFGTNFANGEFYNCISFGGSWNGGAQGGMGGYAMGCKGMNPSGPGTAVYCIDAGGKPVNFGLASTTNNI